MILQKLDKNCLNWKPCFFTLFVELMATFTCPTPVGLNEHGLYNSFLFNRCFHKKKWQFSAIHLNIRSIRNKNDDIDIFFYSLCLRLDVIMFTETWLTESNHARYFEGYKWETLVRTQKRGDGVAIYVKENISYPVVKEFSVINSYVECLALCIGKAVIAVMYRPPTGDKGDFLIFLENLLIFLANYTNYRLLSWVT